MDNSIIEMTYARYREFFLNEVMAIDSLFKLYIHIHDKQVDMIEVLNIAPTFFGMTIKAFLENAMTCLSKIYDNSSQTVTIYKFLNFIRGNVGQLSFPANYQEIHEKIKFLNEKLQENEKSIIKLKELRDSFLAHNDKSYIFDDPWKKIGLTIKQIRGLIYLPSQIVNEIGVLKGEPYVDPEALNTFDVDQVLWIIKEHLENLEID